MKKSLLGMAVMALLFTGCNEDKNDLQEEQAKVDMSDFYLYTDAAENGSTSRGVAQGKNCASMDVLNRQLNENPGLYKKMFEIEEQSRRFMATAKPKGGNGGGPGGPGGGDSGSDDVDVAIIPDSFGIINIPVDVIIVAPNANDVTNAQVSSQMQTLNEDFRNTNSENLPSGTTFENDRTDAGFSFTLANTYRFNDSRTSWGTNNAVKSEYPRPNANHLTMWICPIGGGILGYAQFPGGSTSTDGVVVDPLYFGDTGGAFGMGRTMTHEVGHWLNLRHIWGDGRCRQDDFVADTPASDGPNYGCPSYPTVNCKTPDMTMNYMDYVNDACMYMFTDGQRNRMRAIFADNGPRASYLQ